MNYFVHYTRHPSDSHSVTGNVAGNLSSLGKALDAQSDFVENFQNQRVEVIISGYTDGEMTFRSVYNHFPIGRESHNNRK